MNRKYKEFKKQGLCVRCGKERDTDKTRCVICNEAHLKYQATAKTKAEKEGRCRYCLIRPRQHEKSMCKECLVKHSKKQKADYHDARAACIQAYGSKCKCCGNENVKYLQLDHINNDGAAHRKSIGSSSGRGGSNYTWAVKNKFPETLQLLCANCHQAKTIYGGCTEEDHFRH